MKNYQYTICLEPAEEGGYCVTVPALPGCFSQGDTYEEAIEMAKDAIKCHVEGMLKDGLPIPEEPPEGVKVIVERVCVPV